MGGLDTLNEMEKIEVDNKDRPIEDITIEKATVFVDPFLEADEQLAKERAEDIEQQQKIVLDEQKRKQKAKPLKVYRDGVGKYLNKDQEPQPAISNATPGEPLTKIKKKDAKGGFGNFNAW